MKNALEHAADPGIHLMDPAGEAVRGSHFAIASGSMNAR
jgi:hypothetical protein